MTKELEDLIKATLEDGKLEDYEKEALVKRAQNYRNAKENSKRRMKHWMLNMRKRRKKPLAPFVPNVANKFLL